ncbi:unnamed protein product [Oppiella nova]|uniref:C2H2-type domain-containing protein n=1 Tax=Oppiella nova TaxID=334625 RepID=A0A7R9QDK4_9ACAR|nr:unnamed protein product [Oppiella nova]CAG2163713.1 unnamed protein product [Oppiella nova]
MSEASGVVSASDESETLTYEAILESFVTNNTFKCDYNECDKRFSSQQRLDSHKQRRHAIGVNLPVPDVSTITPLADRLLQALSVRDEPITETPVFQYSSADYWDNRSTRPEATTTPLTACIPVLNETSTTVPENTSVCGKRNANHSPTTVQSSPKRIKLRESKELPVPATHLMDTITCSSDSDSNIDDIEIINIDIPAPEVVDNNDTKPTKQIIETPVPDTTHNTQNNCVPKSEVIYLPIPPVATIPDFIKNESPINIAIDESMDDVPESPVCVSGADSFSSVARSSDNDVLSDDDDSDQSSDVSDETKQLCQRYDNLLQRVSNMLGTNTSADNGENPDHSIIDHSVSDSHCPSVDNPDKQITSPPEANTLATDVTNKIINLNTGRAYYICDYEKCGIKFDSYVHLNNHKNCVHYVFKCRYSGCGRSFKGKHFLKKHQITEHSAEIQSKCNHSADSASKANTSQNRSNSDIAVAYDSVLSVVRDPRLLKRMLSRPEARVSNTTDGGNDICYTNDNMDVDCDAISGTERTPIETSLPIVGTSQPLTADLMANTCNNDSNAPQEVIATELNTTTDNTKSTDNLSVIAVDGRVEQMVVEDIPLPSTSSQGDYIQSTTTAPHDSDQEVTDQSLSLISSSSDVMPDHSMDRNPSPSTSIDKKSPPKAKPNKEKRRPIAYSGYMRSDGYLCSDSDDDRPELESFDGLLNYMSSRLVTNTRSPSPVIPPVSDTTSASPVSRRSLSGGEWSDIEYRDCDKLMASFDCDVNNCDKQFDNRLRLNEHKFIAHKILEPYVCGQQDCGKRFERSFDYVRHRRSQHLEHIPYQCEYTGCGNWFAHRSALKYHIKADHMRALPFCCDYDTCGLRKFTLWSLNDDLVHKLKVHAVPYPYVCDYKDCSERFAVKVMRTDHQITVHSMDSKYECDGKGCREKFATKRKLEKHKSRYHQEVDDNRHSYKRYKCVKCDKYYDNRWKLRAHEWRRHGIADELPVPTDDRDDSNVDDILLPESTHPDPDTTVNCKPLQILDERLSEMTDLPASTLDERLSEMTDLPASVVQPLSTHITDLLVNTCVNDMLLSNPYSTR